MDSIFVAVAILILDSVFGKNNLSAFDSRVLQSSIYEIETAMLMIWSE